MQYDIQVWLYDDTDEEEVLGFSLWLQPLYVYDPKLEPLLTLQVKPGEFLDYSTPSIAFQLERKGLCRVDFEEAAIHITIQFSILVDLEQHRWQFHD